MSSTKEYETQSSAEAQFVKDVDKFDMILQAYEYETADDRPKELEEFFQSTEGIDFVWRFLFVSPVVSPVASPVVSPGACEVFLFTWFYTIFASLVIGTYNFRLIFWHYGPS